MAAMTALVVLTASIIGFLTSRTIEAIATPRALDHIDARVRLLAAELEASVRPARADVIGFRSAVAVEGIVKASRSDAGASGGISLDEWRNRLARRFAAELAAKPSYGQFRLIGVADGGREIIRVDRSGPGNSIRIVPDAELQRKGDRGYFPEVIRLSADEVSVSPIELNQEHGVIEVPHVPVMRAATSILAPDGQPFGIIVINVDLRPAFARIRAAAARTGDRIYVTNERGDYLVHPDPSREFAFQFARAARVQDDFPQLNPSSPVPSAPSIIRDSAGSEFGAAMISVRLAQGPWVALVAMVPYSQILAASQSIRSTTLLAGLVAVLLAIALAILIMRSLTEPITQMTRGVEAFGRGAPMSMPTDAAGEIGVLARAFQRMGTEVREKAAALARETAERRRLFDTTPDLILVTDRQGRFLQVSPSSSAILGHRPSEMVGRSAVSFVHPEDLDPIRQEMRLARCGHQIRNFETRYLHRDGHVVTLVWSGAWSEPEQRYFFIGRDRTEQKLVEEKFRLAFEASPTGKLMTDPDGKIIMANAGSEKMFGYSRDELIGQSIDMLVPLRFRDKHPAHRRAFGVTPGARPMGAGRDLFGLRKDGTEFPVEVGLNPIQTRDGLAVLSAVVDVTERKRNEQLKSEFVAIVSHELRTPLTSIAGSLRLLDGGAVGPIPDPVRRLIRVALDNSNRLTRLINDILDIERLEAGKVSFHLRRTDVKLLVEQAIEANAAFADTFNAKVRLEEDAADAVVSADPDRLMQVLINLLSNAVKFSPLGEEVAVTIRRGDGRVRIGVRDRGSGVPEEFRRRIFEKFAQADGTDARRRGGSGLGLSIAQQIVTRLGGTISYEAAPGGGTIFIVDLPEWGAAAEVAGGAAGGEEPRPDAETAQARRPEAAA
jgi:PAS domain S-box-containing protein